MNDLIDKLSVCEILADIYPTDGEKVVGVERIDKAYEAVLTLPSAQPEIIRCKDCKYWNPYYAECEGIGNWFGFEGAWSENGYCYKAERREE